MSSSEQTVHAVSETNWQMYLALLGIAVGGLVWYLINSMFRCATPDEGTSTIHWVNLSACAKVSKESHQIIIQLIIETT